MVGAVFLFSACVLLMSYAILMASEVSLNVSEVFYDQPSVVHMLICALTIAVHSTAAHQGHLICFCLSYLRAAEV